MKAQTATEIKERPILFSGEMVRAILDGRKTQTRRIISDVPETAIDVTNNNAKDTWFWVREHSFLEGQIVNRYGKPGDRLWVRETFADVNDGDFIFYKATDEELFNKGCEIADVQFKWTPSIFMPRHRSRITLEIRSVRVERLQEISEEDAKAEGIIYDPNNPIWPPDPKACPTCHGQFVYTQRSEQGATEVECDNCNSFVKQYSILWNQINGKKHPWESNPWVWVLEFKSI